MSEPRDPAPIPTAVTRPGLPAEAFSTAKPVGRYPGRTHPRGGDLVITAIFTLMLYVLAVVYVNDAFARDATTADLVDGPQFATILAVVAPIVLAVFSTVFSVLFILRRVFAFWLPVFAMILIVALYSVTGDMLTTAVVTHIGG